MITSHTSLIFRFMRLSTSSPSCTAVKALLPPTLSLIVRGCLIFTKPSSNKGPVVASVTGTAVVMVQVERLTHTFEHWGFTGLHVAYGRPLPSLPLGSLPFSCKKIFLWTGDVRPLPGALKLVLSQISLIS